MALNGCDSEMGDTQQAGMSPKLDEELFSESWYYVGIAHAGLGQLELAVSAYSKALRLRPLYAHVVHERAKAHQVGIQP